MLDDYQPKPHALWIAVLIFVVVAVADSWFRWATFQYQSPDLAYYTQALWLATHGQWHVSLMDVPLMGHHAEPICFLLLPFFWMWSHPMFFIVVQALMMATMPFTAYRIARRMEFERSGAMWMALATLLAPATGFVALNEFHPEALAAPLILLMLEARMARRAGSYWVCFLLCVMCKENVALMLAWMCAVHWLLDREQNREWQTTFNVVPGLLAAAWVAAYVLWLGPSWGSADALHIDRYSHLGASAPDVAGKVFSEPGRVFRAGWAGFTGGNLVWGLLLPFLLLPLLRPRWMIIAVPLFAQHLLSWRSSEWSIQSYHAAPLVPLVWMGAAEAAANLFWRDIVARWMVGACVVAQLWMGPVRSVFGTVASARTARSQAELRKEMLTLIPAEAGVMAGDQFLSHLAKRSHLYSLGGNGAADKSAATPVRKVDAVYVDFSTPAFLPKVAAEQGVQAHLSLELRLHRSLLANSWKIYSKNAVSVFLSGGESEKRALTGDGKKLDEFHLLAGAELSPVSETKGFEVRLVFEVGQNRPYLPWAQLVMQGADGRDWVVEKGPIAIGREGGRFSETWQVQPTVPPGRYKTFLLIVDHPPAHQTGTPARFQSRRFELGEIGL